jgi:hypothetical protein
MLAKKAGILSHRRFFLRLSFRNFHDTMLRSMTIMITEALIIPAASPLCREGRWDGRMPWRSLLSIVRRPFLFCHIRLD